MAKELISQKMQQTCDVCGALKEWELIGAEDNPTILGEMQEWYIGSRKVVINGRMTQLTVDACSSACYTASAGKLALPPMDDESADKIDLTSLRVSNLN
jgi:hypothetical protein